MESVAELRVKLRFKQIADRLVQHEPRAKIARDLNLRPDQLKKIVQTPEFLNYLDEQSSPALSEIAIAIREELEAIKESDATKLILEAEAEATQELLAQMREAEKASDRRAAAIAVIELARKVNADRKDTKAAQKMNIPASQLKTLLEAAREMDDRPQGTERSQRIHQDDGAGAAVPSGVSAP